MSWFRPGLTEELFWTLVLAVGLVVVAVAAAAVVGWIAGRRTQAVLALLLVGLGVACGKRVPIEDYLRESREKLVTVIAALDFIRMSADAARCNPAEVTLGDCVDANEYARVQAGLSDAKAAERVAVDALAANPVDKESFERSVGIMASVLIDLAAIVPAHAQVKR